MTIAPRHPRVLHPGPRIRTLEVKLLVDVVVISLALFLAWALFRRDESVLAITAIAAAMLLALRDLQHVRRLRRLRYLGLTGLIAPGHVLGSRLTRFSRAYRADAGLRREGYPFVPGLEVTFSFQDEQDREWTGRLITSRKNASFYEMGERHEVFYLAEDPTMNISSLVMRWYWRIGGQAVTDEAPEEDFPLEDDIIVEELL